MIPYDSKAHFNKLFKSSYFLRVDSQHPLELLLGVDKEGRKAIRFVGDFQTVKVTGTKAIAVKHFQLNNHNCIQFSLADPETADPFYKFIDDLVDSSRKLSKQEEGYSFVINRYSRWKRMFIPRKEILSESSIMGLIGELYFLFSFLIPKYGEQKAIESWSASDPTVKDFSIEDTWYEVKTTGPKSQTVHLNSVEQLEFTNPGTLVVVRLEKMANTYVGLTLNSMVKTLIDKIVSPEVLENLQIKLEERGYIFNEKYDDFVFECKEVNRYLVNDDFPSLKRGALDQAIADAEYDLLIEKIKTHIIEID